MNPPLLTETAEGCHIQGDDFELDFASQTGPFPRFLSFTGGEPPLVRPGDWSLEWQEENILYQAGPAHSIHANSLSESVTVSFENVPLLSGDGEAHCDVTLSLEYEIFRDGAGFCTFFLEGRRLDAAGLDRLSLRLGLAPQTNDRMDWSYWSLPKTIDASLIQNLTHFGRKIPLKDARQFPGVLLPFVSYDWGNAWRRDRHIEFFLESVSGLSLSSGDVSTLVNSSKGVPFVVWNLQDCPWKRKAGRSIYYRNVFGFCLSRSPKSLRRAPLRIYHFFDNFQRYPSSEVIADARAAGADTLVLHENWRKDERNSELPWDRSALESTVQACRRQGLRLGLYFRANEDGIRERYAELLSPYLRKNIDGLYLDFGSPITYLSVEEFAPTGRVHFREYHRMLRRLRDFVGPDGFILSHSGSFFSALAHASLDGYIGGEQEKGQLLDSREHHAYFAGLAVANGYWWTASYPLYRSPQAVALMAATLHAPVAMLGVQCPTSALHQPPSPEVNTFAHWIWKLWALLDGRGPLRVWDTHRSGNLFDSVHAELAPVIFRENEGDALITVSNLSGKSISSTLTTGTVLTEDAIDRRLIPLRMVDGRPEVLPSLPFCGSKIPVDLGPWEVAGWVLAADISRWEHALAKFVTDVVWTCPYGKEWLAWVDTQRSWRELPASWERCFLRLESTNWVNAYEDSIWVDLFNNDLVVELLDASGESYLLGMLGKKGLMMPPSEPSLRLMSGDSSPWVDVGNASVPRNFRPTKLRVRACKGEVPFYLLFRMLLSPEPALVPETRNLEFCVDIDQDWSSISCPLPRPESKLLSSC